MADATSEALFNLATTLKNKNPKNIGCMLFAQHILTSLASPDPVLDTPTMLILIAALEDFVNKDIFKRGLTKLKNKIKFQKKEDENYYVQMYEGALKILKGGSIY